MTLPSHNTTFAFRFASLNFQLQHRVHYQYKLEGYDHQWVNADKSRTATYSSIPAGKYKFIVRAFLMESPEKYDQKEIVIEVPPVFFLSKNAVWFYILIIAAAGLALLFIRQKQLTLISKREAMQQSVGNYGKSEDQILMTQFQNWLENKYSVSTLSLEEFLTQVQMNRVNFEEKLRDITGQTPREYVNNYRIKKAQEMLSHTNDNIADISYNAGFNDPGQFNRLFTAKTGMTPSQYRDSQHDSDDTDHYEIIS